MSTRYQNIELVIYADTREKFEAAKNEHTCIGVISDTAELWLNGEYYPLIDLSAFGHVYITDFTYRQLELAIPNKIRVRCNLSALIEAIRAKKIILVPYDSEDSGVKGMFVLNGYTTNVLYFSITDNKGNIIWCNGASYASGQAYIDGAALAKRDWAEVDAMREDIEASVKYANKQYQLADAQGLVYGNEVYALPNTPAAEAGLGFVLATQDDIPTEVATATQKIDTRDQILTTLQPNIMYDWSGSSIVSLTLPRLGRAQAGYEHKWMVRLTCGDSSQVTIPFTVTWLNGVAPSWSTWSTVEFTFTKGNDDSVIYGEYKIFR